MNNLKEILKCKADRTGVKRYILLSPIFWIDNTILHLQGHKMLMYVADTIIFTLISLSKSTADPDLHKDPATFGSCLLKWSLHSLQSHLYYLKSLICKSVGTR